MTIDGADIEGPHSELRHYPVVVSVEQLALAWLRTEGAPSGAVVTAGNEIVPRQRLGIPWDVPATQSFSCAAVIRCTLGIEDEALLWIAALVAVARSCESIGMIAPSLGWPDVVAVDGAAAGSVAIAGQLGPGVVQSAVVSLRIDTRLIAVEPGSTRLLALAFARELDLIAGQLKTGRADLLSEYDRRSALIGQRVRVRLLPKGDTRGTVGPVTAAGNLPLESPTGMIELLSPTTVLALVLI